MRRSSHHRTRRKGSKVAATLPPFCSFSVSYLASCEFDRIACMEEQVGSLVPVLAALWVLPSLDAWFEALLCFCVKIVRLDCVFIE